MLTKRTFVALTAAAILAACSTTTEIERAKSDTGPLKLNLVRVDTSGMTLSSEGRSIQKSRAQLASDLTTALKNDLGPVSDPNGLPANVNVSVKELFLADVVDRALVGTSYIESVISVTDAATGEVIIAPTEVRGDSEQLRAGSWVGAITTKSVEEDYKLAVQGYSEALVESLVASKQ